MSDINKYLLLGGNFRTPNIPIENKLFGHPSFGLWPTLGDWPVAGKRPVAFLPYVGGTKLVSLPKELQTSDLYKLMTSGSVGPTEGHPGFLGFGPRSFCINGVFVVHDEQGIFLDVQKYPSIKVELRALLEAKTSKHGNALSISNSVEIFAQGATTTLFPQTKIEFCGYSGSAKQILEGIVEDPTALVHHTIGTGERPIHFLPKRTNKSPLWEQLIMLSRVLITLETASGKRKTSIPKNNLFQGGYSGGVVHGKFAETFYENLYAKIKSTAIPIVPKSTVITAVQTTVFSGIEV